MLIPWSWIGSAASSLGITFAMMACPLISAFGGSTLCQPPRSRAERLAYADDESDRGGAVRHERADAFVVCS